MNVQSVHYLGAKAVRGKRRNSSRERGSGGQVAGPLETAPQTPTDSDMTLPHDFVTRPRQARKNLLSVLVDADIMLDSSLCVCRVRAVRPECFLLVHLLILTWLDGVATSGAFSFLPKASQAIRLSIFSRPS